MNKKELAVLHWHSLLCSIDGATYTAFLVSSKIKLSEATLQVKWQFPASKCSYVNISLLGIYKISTNLCKLVLFMMARNSENPTVPPPSLEFKIFIFHQIYNIFPLPVKEFTSGQKENRFFALPVKELKRRPVKSIRLAKVRLKGDKLVERDELGSILTLVKDSTIV